MPGDPTSSTWVAGVDGCRAGWVVALVSSDPQTAPRIQVAATFDAVMALAEAPVRIAVDMPIGLAARAVPGGRQCDVEARSRLGRRQSSVFAVPARAAVMEADYGVACAMAAAHSEPPRRISKQCFNLFGKIRQIDRLMTPRLQARVFECHPEVAFWAMNGGRPLEEPKKVKSRPWAQGMALRRALLAEAGMPMEAIAAVWTGRDGEGIASRGRRGVAEDDLLDALACAWTARRVLHGTALRFPQMPPLDPRGLRMEIWA